VFNFLDGRFYLVTLDPSTGNEKSIDVLSNEMRGNTKLWYADIPEASGYMHSPDYSGYFSEINGENVPNFYGYYYRNDEWTYRGMINEGNFDGMGIKTQDDDFVYIGRFKNHKIDGYGLGLLDGKWVMIKAKNGETVLTKELKGLNLDPDIFFN
jgi:hypothetical protein